MTLEEAKGFEHANIILQALGVQEKVEVVLSQISLRRGDLILVCSDGLHGPVSDDEIKQVLLDEPDVKKACDQLIACANAHEGPDNITVVLARFDGEGLTEPEAEDAVAFLAYDPGQDPEDPEPEKRPFLPEQASGEMAPGAELRATESDLSVPKEPAANNSAAGEPAATTTSPPQPIPEARSVLAFVLVTLLAALAGALFLVYQRAAIPDRSFEGASLISHGKPASLSAVPPAAMRPQMLAAPNPLADAGREP
jgi:hypothetical protein